MTSTEVRKDSDRVRSRSAHCASPLLLGICTSCSLLCISHQGDYFALCISLLCVALRGSTLHYWTYFALPGLHCMRYVALLLAWQDCFPTQEVQELDKIRKCRVCDVDIKPMEAVKPSKLYHPASNRNDSTKQSPSQDTLCRLMEEDQRT